MRRIYFTAVPLESNFLLEESTPTAADATREEKLFAYFPILRIIKQSMQPGDTAKLMIVRQSNSKPNPNRELLLQGVSLLGIDEIEIKDLELEVSQSKNVVLHMFRTMIDYLEDDACYYACITFGTKIWPLVLTAVFNYAEKVLKNAQIKGLYYQQVIWKDMKNTSQHLYDMSVLFSLNSIVNMVSENGGNDMETAIRLLLEDE